VAIYNTIKHACYSRAFIEV